jgi:hypothetical protein
MKSAVLVSGPLEIAPIARRAAGPHSVGGPWRNVALNSPGGFLNRGVIGCLLEVSCG